MRILAMDVGDVRIGIAISDYTNTLAFPYSVIRRESNEQTFNKIIEIIKNENVSFIVSGMPYDAEGKIGIQGKKVKNFVKRFKKFSSLSVTLVDERLTTKQAYEHMRNAGKNSKKAKVNIDAYAATIILQSYLDQEERYGKQQ